jgi:predicted nucleic acid-binding protein
LIVVDASALIEVLFRTSAAAGIEHRLFAGQTTLHIPHLADIEIAQVIRRYVMAGEFDAQRGHLALADLADFPLQRHAHLIMLDRIWELRDNLTSYDAAYVALAEALDAPLITRDRRIATAAGHQARVEVV